MQDENDIVYRLRKRAEIRRNIPTRRSVQEGKPDRISDLLEEAANTILQLRDVVSKPDELDTEPRPKIMPQDPRCPDCGCNIFYAPYTEGAWQRIELGSDGRIWSQEDGNNLEYHDTRYERAECRRCEAKVDLSAFDS